MVRKEVLEYVVKCLRAGKDEKFIKGSLIGAGHDKMIVNMAYDEVTKRNEKPKPKKILSVLPKPRFEPKVPVINEKVNVEDFPIKEDASNETSNKKLLFTLFGAVLVIAVIVAVVVVVSKAGISETDINEGVTFSLAENGIKNFYLKGEEHSIEVNSVYSDHADFTIMSSPLTLTLEVGEKKILNLDDDEYYDLEIELKGIEEFIPVIYLKKTIEKICTEEWMCEGWANCSEFGTQTRLCEDFNNCGTYDQMPEISRDCVYEEEPCTENWNCTDWTICYNETQIRECTDNNTCGTTINKPSEEQNCTLAEYIDCGEVTNSMSDCFISASENCSLATSVVSYTNVLDPNTGNYISNYTQLISIDGWNDTNCSYSTEYSHYSHSFSEEYIQELLLGGSTMEEIEKEEQDANESMQTILNSTGYCLINKEGFTEMLEVVQENGVPSNPLECWDLEFSLGDPSHTYSLCEYNGVNATSYCWTYQN